MPINLIVVVAIALLVLSMLIFFFLGSSGTQITRAEAEKIFSLGCSRVCNFESDSLLEVDRITNAFDEYRNPDGFREQFRQACVALGYARMTNDPADIRTGIVTCLQSCGTCETDTTAQGDSDRGTCQACCAIPGADCTEYCSGPCP